MKNIYKIFAIAAGAALLWSCSEDPSRTQSPAPNPDAVNAYFPSDIPGSVEVEPGADIYTVTVARVNADAAIDISLTKSATWDSKFSIPDHVSFAADEDEVEFDITFNHEDLEFFEGYTIEMFLDPNQLNPYDASIDGVGNLRITIIRADWAPIGTGTFESSWGNGEGEDTWNQVLEYSELSDRYRMTNLYNEGYNFIFVVDEEPDEDGITHIYFEEQLTGDIYPPNYPIYMGQPEPEAEGEISRREGNVFYFWPEYYLELGTFGIMLETLTMPEEPEE